MTLVRFDDGNVSLAYDDVGRGDPPVLLIHGMSCNRTHWNAQRDFLAWMEAEGIASRVPSLERAGAA